MSSELKANKISPATGTATTLGDSGDVFSYGSGAGGLGGLASVQTFTTSGTVSYTHLTLPTILLV